MFLGGFGGKSMRKNVFRSYLVCILMVICAGIFFYGKSVAEIEKVFGDDRANDAAIKSKLNNYQQRRQSSEEERHIASEEANWIIQNRIANRQLCVSILVFAFSILAIYFSYGAFKAGSRQAQIAADQVTLAYPPKVELVDVHIWEKGRGSRLDRFNKPPDMRPGSTIEGSAFVVNFGRESCYIISSDIFAGYARFPLNMYYPGWGDPGGGNSLKDFDDGKTKTSLIPPGGHAEWHFNTNIVAADAYGKDFLVVGNVVWEDRLHTRHALYFVERYDAGAAKFVNEHTRIL